MSAGCCPAATVSGTGFKQRSAETVAILHPSCTDLIRECPVRWNRSKVSGIAQSHIVMPALVAGIHVLNCESNQSRGWPEQSPAMTEEIVERASFDDAQL